jgi:hypothetical protein
MQRTHLLMTLAGIAALAALLAGNALSAMTGNTIAPTATIEGKRVLATGLVACTAGQRLELEITVTQRSSGAVARGKRNTRCTGSTEEIPVRLKTRGKARFAPGNAEACAFGVNRDRQQVVDAHQWCREGGVTLSTG